jgi:serine/threonine protein kinase
MPLPWGASRHASHQPVGLGNGRGLSGARSEADRDVAIKSCRAVSHADRVAWFDREARTLAHLSHPNIGSIYGLVETEGVQALVLEFVDGPTLADWIRDHSQDLKRDFHGHLEDTLRIARQIVDALEAAHAAGVVHRDLKPANVKLRADGTVKVLDFGLAKALDAGTVSASVSVSPTLASPAAGTAFGTILGTAAYMSPEQARGKAVDKRADIWAFGCVLFEMLTGTRAFDGGDIADALGSILRGDPNWHALDARTPASVRRVLRRMLEKDPKHRLADIADARFELDPQSIEPAAVTPAPVSRTRRRWVRGLAEVAGGADRRGICVRSKNAAVTAGGAGAAFRNRPAGRKPFITASTGHQRRHLS